MTEKISHNLKIDLNITVLMVDFATHKLTLKLDAMSDMFDEPLYTKIFNDVDVGDKIKFEGFELNDDNELIGEVQLEII